MEAIDLYQLHWPDWDGVDLDETWGAMAALVDEGLVRWIGLSNFSRSQIEQCLRIRHVDSLQPHFSMLYLEHRELIAWCGQQGVGVVCYGPLGYGLLTGAVTADSRFDEGDWRSGNGSSDMYEELFAPGKLERSLDVAAGLRDAAGRLGVTQAQLALAWTFHQPGVTAAIAGSRNPEHVRENAAAGNIELDSNTLDELDSILGRGPGFPEG